MAYNAVLGSILMGLGLLAVLRAVIIIMRNEAGRFPFDPTVSIVIGFALILLGQSAHKCSLAGSGSPGGTVAVVRSPRA